MTIQLQAWLLITGVLVVFELLYRDLLTGPFAAGAAVTSLMVALGAGSNAQWLAFIGVSSALTILVQRVVIPRRLAAARPASGEDEPAPVAEDSEAASGS